MQNKSSLTIRNGHVIDPAQKLEGKYDILLKDGRVAEVAAHGKLRGKAMKASMPAD